MSRMHPQDLRAIVAGLIIVSDPSNSNNTAVEFADALLVELERTAKPEADFAAHMRKAMHFVNLPLTEAAAEEMLADNKALRSERDALKAELGALKEEHQVCGKLVPEIQRQERERIIALLAEMGYLSYEVRSAIEIQGEKK